MKKIILRSKAMRKGERDSRKLILSCILVWEKCNSCLPKGFTTLFQDVQDS